MKLFNHLFRKVCFIITKKLTSEHIVIPELSVHILPMHVDIRYVQQKQKLY